MNQGKCKRLALFLLPCTTSVLADAIQRELLDITSKSAVNRNYQALLPLEAKGVVVGGWMGVCGGFPVRKKRAECNKVRVQRD
jgi:hypothetical protein